LSAISIDKERIATGSKDKSIKLWTTMNNGLQCVNTKTLEDYISVLLKINDELIAAAGFDGHIRLLSSANLDCTEVFEAHKSGRLIYSLIKLDE
jgi:WD40 repeat protein